MTAEVIYFFISYLWISSASLSASRVKARVKMGGHNVPRQIIYRRYNKSVINLFTIYEPLCDNSYLFDNSHEIPILIFEREGRTEVINNKVIYYQMRSLL